MMKLKKLLGLLLSGVLCVTMYGCSRGNSSSSSEQKGVRAELAEAINQYHSMTFEHYVETVEASDPSMWYEGIADDYGEKPTSIRWEGESIYEMKKDTKGNVTDCKGLKYAYTKTLSFGDGTSKQKQVYYPGDGYEYKDYYDGEKTKEKYKSYFQSVEYDTLNIDRVENITATDNGAQKIFNFDLKKDRIFTYWNSGYEREDSDAIIDTFSGILTINKTDGAINYTETIIFKDKNTGATLKYTYVGDLDNSATELEFPNDLPSYKEA